MGTYALQETAGAEDGHSRIGSDMQEDTLVGRDEEDGATPHGDVGQGSGGGGSGLALHHQEDARAVNRCHGVLLDRSWYLYPHDGEVWHWGVVEEDTGVRGILDGGKDFGAGRCRGVA